MIIGFAILIYKLVMRFPILVLVFYVAQFGDVTYEKEIEEDNVEIVQEVVLDIEDEAKGNDINSKEFPTHYISLIESNVRLSPSYIKTAYLKLYILYSNFSTDDECCSTLA